jgi:hypothetical protein
MVKLLSVLVFSCLAVSAAVVNPLSYDMPNGYTGSYNYWDESYSGAGNTMQDGAPLTGGLGDLTDGMVATDNWFVTEAPAGPGPYVGWTINPLITFRFAGVTAFGLVRIHFDDSDGNGGVSAPLSVTINGTNYLVSDPAGPEPFWAEFNIAGVSTDTLDITLERGDVWVFASEFEFQDSANAIPEPSTFGAGALAIAALGALRFRRHRG